MTYIPEALREIVVKRANGCCEYCLMPGSPALFAHEIDHIIPEKHRGATNEDNLCLSCMKCNRHKGSNFGSYDPTTKEVAMLFNPREDQWGNHFRLNGAPIEALTPTGLATVAVLRLNDPTRLQERQILIEAGLYPCKPDSDK